MHTLYKRILKEKQKLKTQIEQLQSELQTYPDGKLICCHHRNQCKWYQSDGHNRTYISKKNRTLAEQLAVKKYLSCMISDLSKEKRALDFYLNHHSNAPQTSQLLYDIPGFKELLSPFFKPTSESLAEWMNYPYERNLLHPEHLIHKTISGHVVRSKSEAMICHFLYTNRIPFRYECALSLDSITMYPDFTIRHPETGETYYWEHFGLMDDASYCQNMASKLHRYSIHGIIPSIHLITTYETLEHPLTIETIQLTIEQYFL